MMLNTDKNEKILNAKQMPRVYYCRHMQEGVAGYDSETIMLELETLKKVMPSFVGKPLYVHHVEDINLEALQETADGYVTSCFYNEKDGWIWAQFIAVSDAAHEAIANGWSVSNAYIPTESGASGTWHNVDYSRKILDAEFTHLAIVPNPRYEDAKIYTPEEYKVYQETLTNQLKALHNSKETKKEEKTMFKLFKNTKQEVTSIDADTMIELQNGKEVSIADMIEAITNAKKNEAAEEEKMNMDSEVEVGDEKMPLKELVNRYNAMAKKNAEECAEKEKANAEAEEDKKAVDNEADEDKEKENEKDEDEKQQKKNDKYFEQLKNAHNQTVTVKKRISGEALGKERYGKK